MPTNDPKAESAGSPVAAQGPALITVRLLPKTSILGSVRLEAHPRKIRMTRLHMISALQANDEKRKRAQRDCALGVSGWKKRLFPAVLKAQAQNSKAAEEEQARSGFRDDGDGEIVNTVGATRSSSTTTSGNGRGIYQAEIDRRGVVQRGYRAEVERIRV